MSDPLPPSSQPVTPYEASQSAARAQSKDSIRENTERREYWIHMAWADRRRFLRSAFPLRLAAVAGAVIGFYALYGLLSWYLEAWRTGEASGFRTVSRVVDV